MILNLSGFTTITKQPAVQTTISAATLNRIVDRPGDQVVLAFIAELNQPLILWSGTSYSAIGDWTQDQADALIINLIQGM